MNGLGQSVAFHRALRVLPWRERSNRASQVRSSCAGAAVAVSGDSVMARTTAAALPVTRGNATLSRRVMFCNTAPLGERRSCILTTLQSVQNLPVTDSLWRRHTTAWVRSASAPGPRHRAACPRAPGPAASRC